MKKLYHFSFLIAFILLFSVNSCKKEAKTPTPLPGKVADTHVLSAEINAWFDKMPQVKPASILLQAAQQATINGVQVVRIPIATNAALYFTKENDSLKVYAYKWIYNNLNAEKYTGNIDAYSFQSKNFVRMVYVDGELKNQLKLASVNQEAFSNSSNNSLKTTLFDNFFEKVWCWLTGGTTIYDPYYGCSYSGGGGGGSSSSGGFPIYVTGGGGSSSGGSGFTGSGGGSGGGATWGPPPCPPTPTIGEVSNKLKINKVDPNDPSTPSPTGCVVVNGGQWNPYMYSLYSTDPATDDPNFNLINYININDIDYYFNNITQLPTYTDDSYEDYRAYSFDPNTEADFIDVTFDPSFTSNTRINDIYNKLTVRKLFRKCCLNSLVNT